MILNKIRLTLLLAAIGLAACQTTQTKSSNDFFSGKSHADAALKTDTTKMITMLINGKGCSSVDHIDTKVLHYEATTGKKGHEWGKEGWMATACGEAHPYFVTFTEDGNGGTYFGLQPATR